MNPFANLHEIQNEAASDALRELGNVAFSHAATALSSLVGRRVDVSLPNVRLLEASALEREVGATPEPQYIITLRVLGDRQGTLALVLPEQDGLALADMLEGLPVGTRSTLSMDVAALLKEVANVMSGSALLAMHRFLCINLIHGMPTLYVQTRDDPEASLAHIAEGAEVCMLVETEFSVERRTARGTIVISLTDLPFFLSALEAAGSVC